ncbi:MULTISPECIES: TetR/AcrR family transcriptional regulator [unclassified Streptomyces]|uniref:TetR/AcrR family transcriptional regulator n=1 Tax=unclassified Streptomyces TaxID=2593676 RepID=UPI00081E6F5B|nr:MULTISPECIES: TetR/AcrR family transcriptional regulator [unclassified Streptomyces]MYZ35630.1 TetR family transcriptional regulator [Streptomyces sp. SID4917]SCF77049.1 transcriptional regulator, TetR family [Streptomyces sp. MnatMP-M17]
MTGPDRPRRGYDSSGRQAAAARNRAAILDACRESLLRDGYRATSVQAVARRAGVSVPTVYKVFGSKQELVKAVYDTTLAQDDEPVPMHARPELRAVLAETDPAEKLAGYARFVAGVHERLATLTAALSAADPELAELAAVTDRERRTGTGAFVDHLATAGMLRPGLDPVRAADSCWLLTSPQVHERLTRERGWTAPEYRQWLAQMLAATLLP